MNFISADMAVPICNLAERSFEQKRVITYEEVSRFVILTLALKKKNLRQLRAAFSNLQKLKQVSQFITVKFGCAQKLRIHNRLKLFAFLNTSRWHFQNTHI